MADLFSLLVLAAVGLAIGFVGGMVGLVLGVLRFPFVLGAEASASVAAGTNIGVSALGALTAAVRHMRQSSVHRRVFAIMAGTGAAGALCGSLLTRHVPAAGLLLVIAAIVSYEARVAVGTNLAASAAMGAAGFAGHALAGQVDYLVLVAMGPAAMAGGYIGARYTGRFSERTLRLLIGVVLAVVAAVMFWQALS